MSAKEDDKFSVKDELFLEKMISGVGKKVHGYIFKLEERVISLEKEIVKLSKGTSRVKKPTTAKVVFMRVGIAVLCAIAIAVLPSLFEFLASAFKK